MIPHSQPYIRGNEIHAIQALLEEKVLQSTHGFDKVMQIFADKFNQENLYFTQSGSHALYWVLKGLGFKREDEIILPSYVCASVYKAVLAAGCTPVLCDIEKYWHMSPEECKKVLTKKTKAIIIVNLFGMSLDCRKFRSLGVVLINDLCQSFDVLIDKNRDNGDYVLYSFNPTKFITAGYGGGFSIVNDKIEFTNYLSKEFLGFSTSNLNISILINQLELYDLLVAKRRELSHIYFEHIDERYTKYIDKENNVFYRFPLIQKKHDFSYICSFFYSRGVCIRRGVDELVHRLVGLSDDNFPNAVSSYNQTISLPIYPSLSMKDAHKIISIVEELFIKCQK